MRQTHGRRAALVEERHIATGNQHVVKIDIGATQSHQHRQVDDGDVGRFDVAQTEGDAERERGIGPRRRQPFAAANADLTLTLTLTLAITLAFALAFSLAFALALALTLALAGPLIRLTEAPGAALASWTIAVDVTRFD
jgi:hypothetical protein